MPIPPTNIAQSIAGLDAAARTRAAAAPRKNEAAARKVRQRDEDELIVGAEATNAANRVRNLAGNADEDSREDRQSGEGSGAYQRAAKKNPPPPRIDVAG